MAKFLRTALAVVFRFLRGRRGGATGFAAAAVVMMLLGGGALISDHVWIVGKRDLLQSAAGAASVATTQRLATLPGSMTDTEVHAELLPVAERYARLNVLANVGKELEPDDIVVTLAVDRDAGVVEVRVSADIGDTLLTKWLYDYGGPGDMEARAGAEYEPVPAEVVLAIDTTGSMRRSYPGASSRLAAVKAAAKDLVGILQPSEASDVAVGLVPWTIMVRLGANARAQWHNEGWAEFPARRRYPWPYLRIRQQSVPPAVVQDIPERIRGTWHGCLGAARIEAGVASLPDRDDALDTPDERPFAEYYAPPATGISYRCFGDDPEPGNLRVQRCWDGNSRSTSSGRQIAVRPADPQRSCSSMAPLMPLSTDQSAIEDAIDDIIAPWTGTHSAFGVQWGRRLLAPTWRDVWGDPVRPVDPADPDHADVRKVLVLLTDGENVLCEQDFDYDCPSGTQERPSLACDDAKADGIEVFVVTAMDPRNIGSRFERSLRACASSGEHVYINNPDAPALRRAFRDIAKRVSKLRRVF